MRTKLSVGWMLICAALAGGATADTSTAAAYARGALVYERCAACHALEFDRTGPRHCGLIGRRAGSIPGFPYSPAMRGIGLVWDERTLDQFLRSPTKTVPGTSMGYDGIKDDGERRDLIVFLREVGYTTTCQKPSLPAQQPNLRPP